MKPIRGLGRQRGAGARQVTSVKPTQFCFVLTPLNWAASNAAAVMGDADHRRLARARFRQLRHRLKHAGDRTHRRRFRRRRWTSRASRARTIRSRRWFFAARTGSTE
jgi:hypothetical protein